MGISQMAELWQELQVSYRNGSISKKDAVLYKNGEKHKNRYLKILNILDYVLMKYLLYQLDTA